MIAAELSASRPLIGQVGQAPASHWSHATLRTWALSTNGPTSCHPMSDVCCNNQLSLYPANKGSRLYPHDLQCPQYFGSLPSLLDEINNLRDWYLMTVVHFLGVKLEQ